MTDTFLRQQNKISTIICGILFQVSIKQTVTANKKMSIFRRELEDTNIVT